MSPRIPGRLNDRRTPLGELNWIFTAITDTIAWNVLPRGEAGAAPRGRGAAGSRAPLALGVQQLGKGRLSGEVTEGDGGRPGTWDAVWRAHTGAGADLVGSLPGSSGAHPCRGPWRPPASQTRAAALAPPLAGGPGRVRPWTTGPLVPLAGGNWRGARAGHEPLTAPVFASALRSLPEALQTGPVGG